MRKITKSLAIASLFPETLKSHHALENTLSRLSGRGFGMVEFYAPPGNDEETAKILSKTGFDSILIGVYALKGAGPSLCAIDEEERSKAVATLINCIDRASVLGSRAVMINSGFLPKNPAQIEAACSSYISSIGEAYSHIISHGYNTEIVLEPGDSCVQSFQLLGPTKRVIETTKVIREKHLGYGLTMDVAHLREESEDVLESLSLTLPYCNHVHLCNCVMDNPDDAFYGDKHVDFDHAGASFTYESFEKLYDNICEMYAERDFTITLEIQCRAQDNDAWFDEVARRCSWLFKH